MPEIMNVTNPVPGYDNAAGNRSILTTQNDPNVSNIPNPDRINRPDSNTGEQQNAANQDPSANATRFDSNFQTFFRRLAEMDLPGADLTRTIAQAFESLKTGSATDFPGAIQLMQMSSQEFSAFFANQLTSGSRFNGPLFSLLRSSYQQTTSERARSAIVQFVKQYSDWSSAGHIQRNILTNLNQIAVTMPKSWGSQVGDMGVLLQNLFAANDRAGSLNLLQGKIIPYLSEYVSVSHDMGTMRKILSQLVLNVARYENGSQEALLDSFRHLSGIPSLYEALKGASDQQVLALFRNTPFQNAAKNDWFANQLAGTAGHALRGGMGVEAQEAFRNLVSSILVNNSVYMPLNHYILPLDWNGHTAFSELWVDPDADESGREVSAEDNDAGRTMRLLLKLDIQSVGLLDVVIAYQSQAVSMQVLCPPAIASFSDVIQKSLVQILQDNDLHPGTVQVEQRQKAVSLSDVFPKIRERRDSINVAI